MDLIIYPVKFAANTFNLYVPNNGIFLNPNANKEFGISCVIPVALFLGSIRYGFNKFSNMSNKLKESLIKCLYYYLTFSACRHLLLEEGIWYDTKNCWTNVLEGQVRSERVSAYYIFELSWYLSELFCHFLIDSRKKDHLVMILHHLVTISLISGSYLFGYHRIGLLVLYCHNMNDIFLEGAKCFRSIGATISSNVTFGILILSWIYSRLYLFPFYVIRSTLFETYDLINGNLKLVLIHYVFNGLLFSLLLMHIYWFYLICRIAVNAIKNGEAKDERED
jgi:hypothetical protein